MTENLFKVLKNHENQYALWPINKELPLGWIYEGIHGSKERCLEYIKEVWIDLMPLSTRLIMETNKHKGDDFL